MKKLKPILYTTLLLSLFACSDDDATDTGNGGGGGESLTGSDLTKYSSGTQIMMQAFYWDVPSGGTWYNTINTKIENWKNNGVNIIWLPAPGKGNSGGYSMGYDPYDYFDVGEYNQKGSTETRFGSKEELSLLLANIKTKGMKPIADIVINHNLGADEQESTPNHGLQWTKFTPLSGKFNRTYLDFVPYNGNTDSGESGFGEQLDLTVANVQDNLWLSSNSVAAYYKSLGFEGWRFDYVKGFAPSFIAAWNSASGNLFSVGEYWDGETSKIATWVNASGASAFDFANFYNMEKAFDSSDNLALLKADALFKVNAEKAVTFVTNHDADDRDSNTGNWIATDKKIVAYAYILTHPGLPQIFYSDYENRLSQSELNNLMLINKTIAKGNLNILYSSADEYIAAREGDSTNPGLIIYINTSNSIKTHAVTTHWKSKSLFDYAKKVVYTNTSQIIKTDASGNTTLNCPRNSYTIWSVK